MTLPHLKTKLYFSCGLFFIFSALYFFWSYILVDGNLVLSNFSLYWQFQQWLWQHILPNKQLLSLSYLVIVLGLFLGWFLVLISLKELKLKVQKRFKTWQLILIYLGLTLPFILAYNALSYDVFNYIFNAKMVIVYHANPHIKTALDFSFDPWTRFMHNVHTPAPYGYGWTGLSLLPYLFGLSKFTLTLVVFKLFSLLSVIWLFFSLNWIANLLKLEVKLWVWASLFLNPLFLIEILGNAHNDLWMMNLLLVAIGLLLAQIQSKPVKFWRFKFSRFVSFISSILAFLFAGWIKLASLAVTPWYLFLFLASFFDWQDSTGLRGVIVFWLKPKLANLIRLTPLIASVLLFLLLLTDRSKQFLPWYLVWSLVWLPLLITLAGEVSFGVTRVDKISLNWLPKISLWWALWLLSFSFSSLLRYLPWLYQGGYNSSIIHEQKLVTWGVGLFIFVVLYLITKSKKFIYWFVS